MSDITNHWSLMKSLRRVIVKFNPRNIIFHPLLLLPLLFVQLSCKKIQCNTVNQGDPILSIDLFPDHKQSYSFVSVTDTIKLIKEEVKTTPAYRGGCDQYWYYHSCDCDNYHIETYKNEEFSFKIYLDYSFVDDQPPGNLIICDVTLSGYGYLISKHISFEQSDVETQLSSLIVSEIILNSKVFNDVYKFAAFDETSMILIKPNVGLIAIYYNGKLYDLMI